MDKDLRNYIAACVCHNVKYKNPVDNITMGSLITSAPNELVAIDCAGPLTRTSQGHTHIIVIIDHFSKFIEVAPTAQPTGAIIVDTLLHLWILRYGPPNRILSDNGPEFRNIDVQQKLCETFGIAKIYTTPLHPQGNGIVERMMRPLKTALAVFMSVEFSREWDKALPTFAYAYNTTLHATTGEVPYYLWFGRPPPAITPIEATETSPLDGEGTPVEKYKRQVILELQQAYLHVFNRLRMKQQKSQAQHDADIVVELWQPGDLVYLYSPEESSKTGMLKNCNPWTGPFQVLRTISDTSVLIRTTTISDPAATKQVHSSRLRRYYAPFVQAYQKPTHPYAFQQTFLSRRTRQIVVQYKVRWNSLRFKPDSWVNADHLPENLIAHF
jgi:hypothetical protein